MESVKVSWTELKATQSFADLRDYDEQDNKFVIVHSNGLFTRYCELDKNPSDTTDLDDWNTNFKATWRTEAVSKASLTFGSDSYKPQLVSFDFTATKTTATTGEYEIDTAYAIHGGILEAHDWVKGDYIEVDIYDKNNVLGQGAGFVLQQYARKWFVLTGQNRFQDIDVAILPAPGLFFRCKYTSIGTVNDVHVIFNILSYQVS